MPQLTDDASASQIANDSITIDIHQTTPREEISYTQQLANAHDSEVHNNNNNNNNNLGTNNGDHHVMGADPPLVVASHREYNTNNWSVHEMLVLQAAKLEFESNKARNHQNKNHREKDVKISSKERWTWIENACWKAGVLRSQKQCHDKWEGVTTQFRKVEKFNEKNVVDDYWSMSQIARKHNKLPSNFSREVFDALRKNHFGGGGNNTTSDSTLRNLGVTNHEVDGDEDAARRSSILPNRKRKLEISNNEGGGVEDIATAILSAVDRADERHKELMEFERAKFEFEKEKFHGFANLGNGFVRVLMSINEAIKERFDSNRATSNG